jgi:hypothetical protein
MDTQSNAVVNLCHPTIWAIAAVLSGKSAANEFAVPEGWDDQWAQRMLLSKIREAVQTSSPHLLRHPQPLHLPIQD